MIISKILNFYKDASEANQLSFPDVASPISEQLVFFHDNVMFIVLLILMLVGWLLISAIYNKYYYKYLVEGTLIEII